MKVYGYLGHIPPFALNLGHFTPGETALIPIEQEVSWMQSWPGCFGEDKHFLLLPGI
jgi:hypothetical protein